MSVALLLFASTFNAEAKMNKCTNGKQITYTTEPCEDTGLKPAGPIKNAVTVMAIVPKTENADPKKAEKDGDIGDEAPVPSNMDPEGIMPRPVKIQPVNPLIKKLLN